ncbi:hypothetical protein [Fibrobacter sp. UWEL]|uniref:hypothetical protein n=1 Tax=Fibrobacter sp. UWEL TaxID=1896209 RepID=UPI00091A903F|nr:hypothetical protein [Fibrobacter sp. UWEL]SHK64763.1 hypothetical protein SAMN05720468_104165 [Fibrobacter sp. UWEL]
MMIDLIGLPGCGKSFFSTRLRHELIQDGFHVQDISRNRSTPFRYKLFFKLMALAVRFFPSCYQKRKIVLKQLDVQSKRSSFLDRRINDIVDDILLHIYTHKVLKSKRKIYINDEGILHKVLYLSVFFDVSVERALEIFQPFDTQSLTIFIRNLPEQSFLFIKERNRKDCSMDFLSDDIMKCYLDKFYQKMNVAQRKINLFEIDRNDSLENRVLMAKKKIIEFKGTNV